MTVSILGCGWFGKALAVKLLERGITVKGSTTGADKTNLLALAGILPYQVKFDKTTQVYDPDFFRCDIIVICFPPGFKNGQGKYYLSKIRRVMEAITDQQITKVIYISSTGVYGDYNKAVDESDIPEPDNERGMILFEAERLFQSESRFRTTIIRFGGLVGPGRNPARFFTGKIDIPNGRAPINLIHQRDCVGITEAIIDKKCFGITINACAPDHPSKAGFYSEMARKAQLPLPQFTDELANWKVVNSGCLNEMLHYKFMIGKWNKYPQDDLFR